MFPKIHISIERWRKNEEFGVWVSNQGRVRLIKNRKPLEPRIGKKGYCNVFTEKGSITVHRLVAYTWLGDKRNEKYTVDHINSNKRDNRVKNLRWVTKEINEAYAEFTRANIDEEEDNIPETSEEECEQWIALLKDKNRPRKEYITLLKDEQKITHKELDEFYKENKFTDITKSEFYGRVLTHIRNNTEYGAAKWRIPEFEV